MASQAVAASVLMALSYGSDSIDENKVLGVDGVLNLFKVRLVTGPCGMRVRWHKCGIAANALCSTLVLDTPRVHKNGDEMAGE